jgi:RND family efflux transporter MFP subunit
MLNTRKILIAVALASALTGCSGGDFHSQGSSKAAGHQTVEVLTVHRSSIPNLFEATGSIKARFNATLSSKVMARVASVFAQEGDSVRKGQVLVELDGRELDAGVQMAQANLKASSVGVDNARITREMEEKTSAARIAQAEAAVQQSRAALSAAQSKLDLVLAGPRSQERTQAHLAVVQAESTLKLAKTQLDRISSLVTQGALPKKNLDDAQAAFEVAQAQRDTAVQSEKIAQEGSRSEEIAAARQGVSLAQAGVRQELANVTQAKAAAMQARVRAEEIRAARAQVSQSAAALRSARVSLGYATVSAPFDGWIVQRTVDPGAMATPGSSLMAIEGGDLRLETIVPEGVLSHVRKGARVRARIDALDRELEATVSEILPQGDAASHTFVIKLLLPPAASIRSGMFGRAFFTTGRRTSLEVPAASVWIREGLNYVFVVNSEGIARLRIVTTGETRDDRVEVLSGLSPGDKVVGRGRESISDGVKVRAK